MTEKKDGGFATSTEFFQAVIAAGDTTSSFQSVVECSQGGMTKDLRLQALEKPGEHDKWNQVEQQLKFSTVEADQEEYKRQLDRRGGG